MKVLSWFAVFIVTLFVALALVLTFTQPEFKTTVGAQILTYKTRQLPVYSYVAGAFVAGLLIGIFQALFTFIRLKAEIFRKNRVIRELEQKVAGLEEKKTPASSPPLPPAAQTPPSTTTLTS